jgi:hypothetical protein
LYVVHRCFCSGCGCTCQGSDYRYGDQRIFCSVGKCLSIVFNFNSPKWEADDTCVICRWPINQVVVIVMEQSWRFELAVRLRDRMTSPSAKPQDLWGRLGADCFSIDTPSDCCFRPALSVICTNVAVSFPLYAKSQGWAAERRCLLSGAVNVFLVLGTRSRTLMPIWTTRPG